MHWTIVYKRFCLYMHLLAEPHLPFCEKRAVLLQTITCLLGEVQVPDLAMACAPFCMGSPGGTGLLR